MKINGRKTYKPGPKDECGSPYYSIVPLLKSMEYYRLHIGIPRKEFVILEPATGMVEDRMAHLGLVEGLEFIGYRVLALRFIDFTNITLDDIDELCKKKFGQRYKVRLILTNPPFSVALKRQFINQCNKFYIDAGMPYALLMNTTTLVEKINGQTLRGCALHVPFGRICFNMPNKGWGTVEKPTKATFTTNWFSKGLSDPHSIHYNGFDMSDHFNASDNFYVLYDNYKPNWR